MRFYNVTNAKKKGTILRIHIIRSLSTGIVREGRLTEVD